MPLRVGDRLGGYEVLTALGEGGMGAVWKARDTKLGRMVAIKVLKHEDGDFVRLIQEARTAAQLNHPNIVTIHEIGEHDGAIFVVMELIEGETLQHHIRGQKLPLAQALEYAGAVACALEMAHRSGVVHRDLKPQNVMVTASGDIKLLDFGLAKRPVALPGSGDPTLTAADLVSTGTGQILGTIEYMSPEQAQGQRVDARSDIFSFGSLLYEMVTGRRPFTGPTSVAVIASVLRDEPSMEGVPPAVAGVVRRCQRKDPAARYQTIAELRRALTESAVEPLSTARPRTPWMAVAVGAAVTAVAGSLWWTQREPRAAGRTQPKQLTFDPGFSGQAAISPDGRFLAFASDRAETGNLDIWLRPMSGGNMVRLTNDPGLEYLPQFSADGTSIYYLTGDQAIIEKPVRGGQARTVLREAGPFSVSAKGEIVFARSVLVARPEPMWILPAGGASPVAFHPECASGANPVWSPDGEQVFFYGVCGGQRGGFLARKGESKTLLFQRNPSSDTSFTTTPHWFRSARGSDGLVLFVPGSGLSRLTLSGELKPLVRGYHRWACVSPSGDLLLTDYTKRMTIRRLDLERAPAAAAGDPIPAAGHFSVSRDGNLMAFARLTGGTSGELVLKNLVTGSQKIFAEHDQLGASYGSLWPTVSSDGKQVLYRVVGAKGGHFLLNAEGGEPRRIAGMAEFQLGSDWSPDGKQILGECPASQSGICQLDAVNGGVQPFFRHPTDALLYPSWAWDGSAITFMRRPPGGLTSIWIAPVANGVVAPKESWFAISPPETDNSRPRFSPDGATVYYMMNRSGVRRLLSQRVDRAAGKPVGEPVVVVPLPIEVTAITGSSGPYPLISVTARQLFYGVVETTANLSMWPLE